MADFFVFLESNLGKSDAKILQHGTGTEKRHREREREHIYLYPVIEEIVPEGLLGRVLMIQHLGKKSRYLFGSQAEFHRLPWKGTCDLQSSMACIGKAEKEGNLSVSTLGLRIDYGEILGQRKKACFFTAGLIIAVLWVNGRVV